MAYTSPTKVARVVGIGKECLLTKLPNQLAFITLLLLAFSNSLRNLGTIIMSTPKLAILVRWTYVRAGFKATNSTEVQKKAFLEVSARTVQRHLKEQGLLCRVWKAKPFLTAVHKEKQRL
jgi:hypothetical protein